MASPGFLCPGIPWQIGTPEPKLLKSETTFRVCLGAFQQIRLNSSQGGVKIGLEYRGAGDGGGI